MELAITLALDRILIHKYDPQCWSLMYGSPFRLTQYLLQLTGRP